MSSCILSQIIPQQHSIKLIIAVVWFPVIYNVFLFAWIKVSEIIGAQGELMKCTICLFFFRNPDKSNAKFEVIACKTM